MNLRLLKLAVGIGIAGAVASASAQDVPWQVDGGSAAVQFFPSNIGPYGLEIVGLTPTAFGEYPMEGAIGFKVQRTSDLQVMTENLNFGHHLGGAVHLKGGFRLKSGNLVVPLMDIRITSDGPEGESPLSMKDALVGDVGASMAMKHPITVIDVVRRSLVLGWADLRITRSAAMALGRPELEGHLIGGFSVFATIKPTQPVGRFQGNDGGFTDNFNADVGLFQLSSLGSMGRSGAFPTGVSGFATLTTSCNKGSTNIDWFAPMNENHPVIVQDLFRLKDGRIEQIGSAYLKHGFLATNTTNSACGVGQHPGTGTLLGPGLTDTYGTGNNGDRYYLGPRSEVNPFTGVWTAWASFFDLGTANPPPPPDGARSLTSAQASALPPHKNRIEVLDSDLIQSGTTGWPCIYQAFYLCENEINLANQIGSVAVNMAWNGSSWSASTTGAYDRDNPHPAITRYVNIVNAAKNVGAGDVLATVSLISDTSQGWIYVACNPIRLGGGLWRYEVAVFNYTSDRQIREVRIPHIAGASVTSIGFRDPDGNAANDWTGSFTNGDVVWSTQTFAQNPNANSLKYGSIYNFTFTSNMAPGTSYSELGLFKPGAAGAVNASFAAHVSAPSGKIPPATAAVMFGVPGGGNVASMAYPDDNRYIIDENRAVDNFHACQLEVTATSPIQTPGSLAFKIESAANSNSRAQTIELYNWSTNAWDVVDFQAMSTTDTVRTITVPAGSVANYVQAGTRQMKARVSADQFGGDTFNWVQYRIDQIQWIVGL